MSADIYQGLLDRGMPPYVAEAFMDSFMSESGLDPTINERNPLVEGSRGGRGLYQLTGPRRRAYEDAYGDDYDVDSQLDWLMHELETTESRARDSIYGTDNRADAVRAITTDFLRPAVDNSSHRIGSWSGGGAVGPTRERAAAGLPLDTREMPPSFYQDEYADNWLGRVQKNKDTMRAGLGDKLGLDVKQMEGIGGGLAGLGQHLMRGGF